MRCSEWIVYPSQQKAQTIGMHLRKALSAQGSPCDMTVRWWTSIDILPTCLLFLKMDHIVPRESRFGCDEEQRSQLSSLFFEAWQALEACQFKLFFWEGLRAWQAPVNTRPVVTGVSFSLLSELFLVHSCCRRLSYDSCSCSSLWLTVNLSSLPPPLQRH